METTLDEQENEDDTIDQIYGDDLKSIQYTNANGKAEDQNYSNENFQEEPPLEHET